MIFPEKIPTLAGERIVLRAMDERDLDALFAIYSNPEAMRYWSGRAWTDRDEGRALVDRGRAHFAAREAVLWGIARKSDDCVIGTCTLFSFHEQNRRAEVGYALGREYWGQGLMNEALSVLIDWAFGVAGFHRIEADIDPRNVASVRALERLGFEREGLLRQRWIVEGEISDSVVMGLLEGEWRRSPTLPSRESGPRA
jgi:ribosomal-protein-alanine N-acetyltransferase